MLRGVRVDGQPVQDAAHAFGLSRPTFYQAQAAFERSGLLGLLPAKKGPRRSHKLTEEVMDFVMEELRVDSALQPAELARRIQHHFDITVHPRSGPRPIGFGVIVRSGICVWLETCSYWTPLIEPKSKHACDLPATLAQSVQVQLAMVLAGRDPQLDRGIAEVLEAVTEKGMKLPARPADPVKKK